MLSTATVIAIRQRGRVLEGTLGAMKLWIRSFASTALSLGLAALIGACSDEPSGPPACEGGGDDFDGVEFAGVWHFEVQFPDFGAGVATLRVERQDGDFSVQASGRESTEVRFDDSGIYVLAMNEIDPEQPDEPVITRTYHVCARDAAGIATGTYEYCSDEECYPATLSGGKVDPLDEPEAEGVTLISEYNGENNDWSFSSITLNVRVHGGMAYMARRYDGLRIVDISDEQAPVERGHSPANQNENYNDVKVVEGPGDTVYALMASSTRGVVVIDVTDPDDPQEVTRFPGSELAPDGLPSVHTLFVEDQRVYLTFNYDDSLRIYDVSDPADPQPLGSFVNPRVDDEGGNLHDLYVQGGRAYLNYWNLGMTIVDTLADPANPVMLGEYRDYGQVTSHSNWVTNVGGRTISVHGDEQYGAHVRIVDVDPQSGEFLETLGSYQTRPYVSVHNILAYADRAYVTYYQDGLRILDLSDPYNPVEAGHFQTWPGLQENYGHSFFEGAIGVDLDPARNRLYLADTHRGLLILSLD